MTSPPFAPPIIEPPARRMLHAAGRQGPAHCATLAARLAAFAPIPLAETKSVALLDRVEVKYVMHLQTLLQLLPRLQTTYRMLEVEGQRLNHYRTLYFDTPDFALYNRHHAGRQERYKVRAREYVDTHLSFLEVKHRTHKKRVVKSRLATRALTTELEAESAAFVRDHCPYTADELVAVLWNHYSRITLVNSAARERVTLDINLSFAWEERHAHLAGIVVAEVKHPLRTQGSAFTALMRETQIRRTSFSKYCIGAGLLYPQLKHNRFKPIYRRLARLAQGDRHVTD